MQEMNEKDRQNYLKNKYETEEKERLKKAEEDRKRNEELSRALNEAKRIVKKIIITNLFKILLVKLYYLLGDRRSEKKSRPGKKDDIF